MPVVVAANDFDQWLTGTPAEAESLLGPAPDGLLEAVPISSRVNAYANDDPSVLDPIQPTLL